MKPVLLLVFNRPEHTKQVLEQVRRVRPPQLFVSADGPRDHVLGEREKCEAVRALFEDVGWDCTVNTHFLPQNRGCRAAVQSGISWFFQHIESGIILEDDCLPDLSFFQFCDELLDRYSGDTAVMHISGNNPDPAACHHNGSSYFFSRFSLVWGWATWRRAWELYDPVMADLGANWRKPNGKIHNLAISKASRRYLLDKFERTRIGELNTWDYSWFYSILKNDGLCLTPTANLVENIGFGSEATHTHTSMPEDRSNESRALAFPLNHPIVHEPIPEIEQRLFYTSQKSKYRLLLRNLARWYFYKRLSG